jgi:hypothetical protein
VGLEQFVLSAFQFGAPRDEEIRPSEFALHANEFAARIAAFFQPVGEDQARRIFLRPVLDGGE